MKLRQAEANCCLYGRRGRVRAESIAVELRRDAVMPKGGRGPYAPDISEPQAALYALVVAAAPTVAQSGETVVHLNKLATRGGETIIAALARQMAGQCRRDILCVRILPDRDGLPCAAEIWLKAGEGEALVEHFARPDMWEAPGFNPFAIGAAYCGPIGHIGGGVLAQFRADFAGMPGGSSDGDGGRDDGEGEIAA